MLVRLARAERIAQPLYIDPLLTMAFVVGGYAAFVLMTSSADPFARTRRSTRRLQLDAGRTVGAALALGWIPTLWLADGRGSALRIGLVTAALLVVLVLAAWGLRAAYRGLSRRRRAARRVAAGVGPVAVRSEALGQAGSRSSPAAARAPDARPDDAQAHMDRLAERMRHHDIGGGGRSAADGAGAPVEAAARAGDDDGTALVGGPPPGSLPALRTEIVKLRKLVIAQHAALEAERASHDRTREREQQILDRMQRLQMRSAALEKMARREFAARRRIDARQQETAEALASARALLQLEDASPPVPEYRAQSNSSGRPLRARGSVVCAALALGLGVQVLASRTAQADAVLSVGDSITMGTVGECSYRRAMTQILSNTPGCDVEFVGSRLAVNRNTAACRADYTPHFGFSGRTADWLLAESRYAGELAETRPERVLLHIGSNDIFFGQGVASTVQDVDQLVDETFAQRPEATLYLANVIPWDDGEAGTSDVGPGVRELGDAIETLVEERRAAGDDVVLVDVRTGFDVASMTVDGVHPNPVGERLIADRFIAAMAADGLCESFAVPSKRLEDRRWYQIGVPGRGLEPFTVRDVFADDLGADRYGAANPSGDWTLYEYVPNAGGDARPGYRELALSSPLEPGSAYWIMQASGEAITVDMPALTLPTPLTPDTACTGPDGCRALPVRTDAAAEFAWNLKANPFVQPVPFGATRARTTDGACATGCDPDAALANRVMSDTVFRYDGVSAYERLRSADRLEPWDGVWLVALPDAGGQSLRWVVPAEPTSPTPPDADGR